MNKKYNLKKICAALLGIYVLCAFLFLFIADEQIKYTSVEQYAIAETPEKDLGELTDGISILQTFKSKHKYLNDVEGYFLTYGRENSGTVYLEVLDMSSNEVLAESSAAISELGNGEWQSFKLNKRINTAEIENGIIGLRFTFKGSNEGSAVTMTTQSTKPDGASLFVNGMEFENRSLCVKAIQSNDSSHAIWYPVALGIVFVFLLLFCGWNIRAERQGKLTWGLKFLYTVERYEFLLKQLISRDFKTKYKRSVLGVLWSFLNPLLTMGVQYVVFSRIFRFDVPAYPAYLLTGVVFFNFFTDATTQAMNAITGNASLITKVYVPKYIYPVSKVLSTSINLLLSLIPLFLVALITGTKITLAYFLIPFGLVCFLLFVIGISFFLSTAMVFFRDMQFLWGVFTLLWMYATPIIYPISLIEGTFLHPFQKINPMYHYVSFFRTIIIDGISPEPMQFILCFGFALAALLIGGLLFKKAQDQFVLHI
ncbi:ABC transporter permease [Lacrimispora sp. NSJ-141]|uniref:Transport permease protein n=1 Tax=Lientehia hominis TaxID=2897778 RepID=A0AAP2RJU7_9FIRM|nr:ABC transporter permease [Lientehia hominis]MCD2492143.1 ABC transporter permease [Lientehia hominis]